MHSIHTKIYYRRNAIIGQMLNPNPPRTTHRMLHRDFSNTRQDLEPSLNAIRFSDKRDSYHTVLQDEFFRRHCAHVLSFS